MLNKFSSLVSWNSNKLPEQREGNYNFFLLEGNLREGDIKMGDSMKTIYVGKHKYPSNNSVRNKYQTTLSYKPQTTL